MSIAVKGTNLTKGEAQKTSSEDKPKLHFTEAQNLINLIKCEVSQDWLIRNLELIQVKP